MNRLIVAVLGVFLLCAGAQAQSLDELAAAVVRVKTYIDPDGRTLDTLGREREGSGVVLDSDGLILTIG